MPFQIATASSQPLVAGTQQPALDPRVQFVELLGGEADRSAVEAGEVDGVDGGHVRDLPPAGRLAPGPAHCYTPNASKSNTRVWSMSKDP
jgi:hypothetical protein